MKRSMGNNTAIPLGKIVSMRGVPIDLHAYMQSQGDKPAIGNARLNARGDKLNRHGQVVQTAEDMRKAYNTANPKAVSKQVALKNIQKEIFAQAVSPADAVKQAIKNEEILPNVSHKKRKLVDPDATEDK